MSLLVMNDADRALAVIRAVSAGDVAAARGIAKPRWGNALRGADDFLALAERLPRSLGPVALLVGETGGGAGDVMRAILALRPWANVVEGWQGALYQIQSDRGPVPMPGWLRDATSLGNPLPASALRLIGRDDVASPDARDAIALCPRLWSAYAAVEVLHALAAKALPEPPLLLLPDLGAGLHPRVQVNLARELFHCAPGPVQIIATTNDWWCVGQAEYEAVLVFARDGDGVPHCKRLSDHPQAEHWRRHGVDAGEFWNSVGERWVLETGAAREGV